MKKLLDWFKGLSKLGKAGVIIGIIILGMIGAAASTPEENNNTPKEETVAEQTAEKPTEKPEVKEETKPLTEEGKIKKLVSNQFDEKTNTDKESIIKIDIIEQIDGGWGVFVEFNANDNLTENLWKIGMEKQMAEVYKALYTGDMDIRTASAAAYFLLVDKYGNEKDDMVYKTILDKEEADKVNWDADDSMLKIEILPSVWTVSYKHPAVPE